MSGARTGDVFRIPIDATRVGYGQVIAHYGKHAYYFTIFDYLYDAAAQPDVEQAHGIAGPSRSRRCMG